MQEGRHNNYLILKKLANIVYFTTRRCLVVFQTGYLLLTEMSNLVSGDVPEGWEYPVGRNKPSGNYLLYEPWPWHRQSLDILEAKCPLLQEEQRGRSMDIITPWMKLMGSIAVLWFHEITTFILINTKWKFIIFGKKAFNAGSVWGVSFFLAMSLNLMVVVVVGCIPIVWALKSGPSYLINLATMINDGTLACTYLI
jgi:hypothetical protein